MSCTLIKVYLGFLCVTIMYSLFSPSCMSIFDFVVFNLKFNSDFSRLRPDVTNRTVRLSNPIELNRTIGFD